MKLLDNQSGHGFIELVLTLPIVFLLAFSSIEAALILQKNQLSSSLSRELASLAFRECAVHSTAYGVEKFDPSTCFETEIRTQFRRKIDKLAPGSEFIVSLYTVNKSDGTIDSAVLSARAADSTFQSKYSKTALANELALPKEQQSELAQALTAYQVLVTGEVSIPYSGIVNIIPAYVKIRAERIYATTVL